RGDPCEAVADGPGTGVDGEDARHHPAPSAYRRLAARQEARPRYGPLQGRRPQAQEARADAELRGRLRDLPARRGLSRGGATSQEVTGSSPDRSAGWGEGRV